MYFTVNFYKLIKRQYEYYKSKYGIFPPSCDGCPCKILIDKMFGSMRRGICVEEIIYLAKKYNIHDNNDVWLCQRCMFTSLKIAKKLFEKEFNKI